MEKLKQWNLSSKCQSIACGWAKYICLGIFPAVSVCFALASDAPTLGAKTIPLAHPANGATEKIGDYLAISGHSSETRWLSLVDLRDFSVKQPNFPATAQFFSSLSLAAYESEQLAFLTTEGVRLFDIQKDSSSLLVASNSMYPVVDKKRLGYMNLALDVNESGLSDLLIPDFNAYHLHVQQSDGSFVHNRLNVEVIARTRDDGPRFVPRPAYALDYTLDGQIDLVFVRDGQLLIFEQQDDGTFPEQPKSVSPGMEISSDAQADVRSGEGRNFEGLTIHRVHDFQDLDGDGYGDLIIRKEAFSSAVEQRYSYQIHYGSTGESGLRFRSKPDTRIQTKGIQFEPVFTDIDGDGRKDFYTPSAEFGVGTIIRALLRGSAGVDIQFYLMKSDRQFDSSPDYQHGASAEVSIGSARVDLPLVKVIDIGDEGRKSLVLGENREHLKIHSPGESSLFEKRAKAFATPLPRDGTQVRVLDLNADRKEDLVLSFGNQEEEGRRNQVQLLFVQ